MCRRRKVMRFSGVDLTYCVHHLIIVPNLPNSEIFSLSRFQSNDKAVY